MRILIGLLALALLGADKPSPQPPAQITYELRVVELARVDWRADVYPKLQLVTRQGNSTVWTAPKEVAAALVKKAQTEPQARIVAAPRIVAISDAPAHVSFGNSRNFVTGVTRIADGPVNHARGVAFAPKTETGREGMSATLRGRKLDQGILTQLALDDSRVVSVHEVKLTEALEPLPLKPGYRDESYVTASIEVPEVSRSEVTGEWLIPNDGVLLVSLGAYTVAEKDGKAGVRERLAVVEATAQPALPFTAATFFPFGSPTGEVNRVAFTNAPFTVVASTPFAIPLPVPAPAALPMPVPAVPSRSLPQPRDAQGTPVALPPLPDEHHAPPTSLPNSSEPCATPQTRDHHRVVEPVPERRSAMPNEGDNRPPAVDLDSTRADYEAADAASNDRPCCEDLEPAYCHDAPTVASKGLSFRIPINGSVTLEIRAVATAKPASAEPAPKKPEPAKAH